MKNINFFRILSITLFLLLMPLILTLIGSGADGEGLYWTFGDFLVMGTLIFTAGVAIDFIFLKLKNNRFRIIALALIMVTFLLIWAELAVDAISKLLHFLFSL